ncbi:MAG: NAD-dependent malic enzyme, mitochondrial, partial [Watsoniomyces obsoletus]
GMASQAPILKENDATKPLVPDVDVAREVSAAIAAAVIRKAREQGLCREQSVPEREEELVGWIKGKMWDPVYPRYEKA